MELVSKKLYVKYMVSLRCKMILKSEMENLNLAYKLASHGAIEFGEEVSEDQYSQLKKNLLKSGMVLLSDSESNLIDKIINTIIEVVHYRDRLPKLNFTDLISEFAIVEQKSILKIFSDVKGISVLQFIVIQKIERAKELLLYDDMSITEIVELLNYKNQDLFLAQFKKVTGLTPAYFKLLKKERKNLTQKHSDATNFNASGMKSQAAE